MHPVVPFYLLNVLVAVFAAFYGLLAGESYPILFAIFMLEMNRSFNVLRA